MLYSINRNSKLGTKTKHYGDLDQISRLSEINDNMKTTSNGNYNEYNSSAIFDPVFSSLYSTYNDSYQNQFTMNKYVIISSFFL